MVLAVPDEPARGRKPVLRDELAVVVAKQQYPPERLRISCPPRGWSSGTKGPIRTAYRA
ncbi:MAG: hypothetical protein JXA30_00280 [Deltaproteobacteria bacterium]|nr:hypothetical protein [Deltaproteobacteria bacterium]